MTKPATTRVPWYEPARFVWWLPWLGLAFALVVIFDILIIVLGGELGTAFATLGLAFAWVVLPNLVYLAAFAMTIASAALLFRGSTRASEHVKLLYKSLPPSRRQLNIALWFSLVAFMVFQLMPFPLGNHDIGVISINSRYTLQILDLVASFIAGLDGIVAGLWVAELIYFGIPITVSLGASLALAYALFMFLFMATLRPSSALLLKRIFYIVALALATVLPFGIVPSLIWWTNPLPTFSFALSHLALFNLLAPVFLLLAVSLVWLYFQRARLAALGASVKARLRWITLGGVALQAFYLLSWAVFAAPNLDGTAEFFYVGSVLLAAFVAVAWFGLLLMVGARRKWDWALFGMVVATQIASLIVVYPGLLTA